MRTCAKCGFRDPEAKPHLFKSPILGFMRGPVRFVVPDVWFCDVCAVEFTGMRG